jgi:hypothetical protein
VLHLTTNGCNSSRRGVLQVEYVFNRLGNLLANWQQLLVAIKQGAVDVRHSKSGLECAFIDSEQLQARGLIPSMIRHSVQVWCPLGYILDPDEAMLDHYPVTLSQTASGSVDVCIRKR